MASPASSRAPKRSAKSPAAADPPPSKVQCLARPAPSTAINSQSQSPIEEATSSSISFTRSRNGRKSAHRTPSASHQTLAEAIVMDMTKNQTKSKQIPQREVTSEAPRPFARTYSPSRPTLADDIVMEMTQLSATKLTPSKDRTKSKQTPQREVTSETPRPIAGGTPSASQIALRIAQDIAMEMSKPNATKLTPSKNRTKSKQTPQREVTSGTPQPIAGEYIVQEGRCQSYQRKQKSFPMCTACIFRKSNSGACKFQSLRAFPTENKVISSFTPMFIDSAPFLGKSQREANLDHVVQYSTPGNGKDVEFIKACIAPTFLSTLAMELVHETVHKETLVTRLREAGVRPVCDGCATTIFSGHFMCCACGKEICIDCYGEWDDTMDFTWGHIDSCSKKRRHTKQQMIPFTYFRPDELRRLLVDVNGYRRAGSRAQLQPPEEFTKVMGDGGLPFIKVDVDEMGEDDFKEIWAVGQPIVLTGCLPRFEISWTPQYFVKHYGPDHCVLVDCASGDIKTNTTVGKFFEEFLSDKPKRPLKLKDWPPADDFAEVFPALFKDFENAIPFPRYTRRKGFMNLASRFPDDLVTPDLGPKMYNAHASSDALGGQGTTKLHLDITDAVNIMTFAVENEVTRERGGAAVWDIFPAEATDTLRTFLRTTAKKAVDDPVLRQTFYISTPQLQQLRDEYGVTAWRIYQNPGDAVFIPAGCAHQVCNLTSCIKVACDFVSPHCIRRCTDLISGNRGLAGTLGGKREDVLQLKTMMMCAWEEMSAWASVNSDEVT